MTSIEGRCADRHEERRPRASAGNAEAVPRSPFSKPTILQRRRRAVTVVQLWSLIPNTIPG
jgi:hypothetical protein